MQAKVYLKNEFHHWEITKCKYADRAVDKVETISLGFG